ncbi:hypothetical protein SDC9_43978 [bioreactor metagenome]|uniref:ABC3 transporter permease C-terminal domain-containing protein n=1 Tax=bioreactor metagenome TaxID=1076179 RepID=A0A644W5U3_9ZZZZ
MAVFVYGFVAVIAFISILNIINTMQTSVSSKTRYLGVMRAVGMSGRQLGRMIAAESAAYCVVGAASGCVLGMLLQKALIKYFLTSAKVVWHFPLTEVVLVFVVCILVAGISILRPLKKVRGMAISEAIGSLQ